MSKEWHLSGHEPECLPTLCGCEAHWSSFRIVYSRLGTRKLGFLRHGTSRCGGKGKGKKNPKVSTKIVVVEKFVKQGQLQNFWTLTQWFEASRQAEWNCAKRKHFDIRPPPKKTRRNNPTSSGRQRRKKLVSQERQQNSTWKLFMLNCCVLSLARSAARMQTNCKQVLTYHIYECGKST